MYIYSSTNQCTCHVSFVGGNRPLCSCTVESALSACACMKVISSIHIRTMYMYIDVYIHLYTCTCTYVLVFYTQLRMAVAEALGFMVHLLSSTALNDQLPKLLPGIMQLYRKHSEHYYISQVHLSSANSLYNIHVCVCICTCTCTYMYKCTF